MPLAYWHIAFIIGWHIAYCPEIELAYGIFKSEYAWPGPILERIIFANLKLHPRKSHLAVEEVDYLGHTIFKGGVRVSKKKSAAVRKLTPPTSCSPYLGCSLTSGASF
jgi:hypothetical protein